MHSWREKKRCSQLMQSLWEVQSVWAWVSQLILLYCQIVEHALIGLKGGRKCELANFMLFIGTQNVQKTPHLNLAHLIEEPTSLGKRWTSPSVVHIFGQNCHANRQLVLRCADTNLDLLSVFHLSQGRCWLPADSEDTWHKLQQPAHHNQRELDPAEGTGPGAPLDPGAAQYQQVTCWEHYPVLFLPVPFPSIQL